MTNDLEKAHRDPDKSFSSPMELAQRADLTIGQRIGILVSWRQKVVASGDSEPGVRRAKLKDIDAAIDVLLDQL